MFAIIKNCNIQRHTAKDEIRVEDAKSRLIGRLLVIDSRGDDQAK